jgi:hypothetical protein
MADVPGNVRERERRSRDLNAPLVLGAIGSVVTLTLLFELLRRKHLREKYAVFWVLVSLATLFIAFVPHSLFWLAALVGVAVPANLLFFIASMVLLAISIQHSHELGRMEERTRSLAEEVALLAARVEEAGTSQRTDDH